MEEKEVTFYNLVNKPNVKVKVTPNKKNIIMIIDNKVIAKADVDFVINNVANIDAIYFILKRKEAKEYNLTKISYKDFINMFNNIQYKHITSSEGQIINNIKNVILDFLKTGDYAVYTI